MTPGLLRIAAFSDGDRGGNPADLPLSEFHPGSAAEDPREIGGATLWEDARQIRFES